MQVWPEELVLELTGIAQGGDAVGHYEGRAVFVSGGLPGEQVRVALTDRQRSFARGRVREVLRSAPERRVSLCPLEGACGAADWRWIEPAAQVRFKQQILHDQLHHLGGLDLTGIDVGTTTDPATDLHWNYRTTAELHWDAGKLGYYAPGGRNVLDLPGCCLHHPLLNSALEALRPLLTPDLPLRGLTLRCAPSTGEVLGILDMSQAAPEESARGKRHKEERAPDLQALASLASRWKVGMESGVGTLVGVLAQLQRRHELLLGRDWLLHDVAGVQFEVGARTFFQGNASITPQLIARVLELVAPQSGEQLLDLYCGVGAFALPLARQVQQVVGVETYAPAITDARRSAHRNAIHNVEWHAAPAEKVLPRLQVRCDAAVLDPPRRGCEPELLAALVALRPRRIVYVSCHPGTLARDCKQLVAGGYHLTSAEVINMFPQTHHVESIVRLERAPA